MIWPAPAKLNLMLRILGRRADGYHRLQTVFQFLDFGDQLEFSPRRDSAVVRVGGLTDVAADEDLVVRAARALQAETGCRLGVDIHLTKRIPAGGGLGGGSSDAATTLVALNRVWSLQLDTERLMGLGLGLGADVPVFVRGQAAWAEGVGELLSPVDLPEPWYLVVTPPEPVPTAEVFALPELTRDSPPITIDRFLSGEIRNDCEDSVFSHYPAVREVADWLSQWARPRLTGTGASVFVEFGQAAQAQEALGRMPGRWAGFVARGCNRSPLRDGLAELE